MPQLFTEKYKPKTLAGFVGNKEIVSKVKQWADNWKIGDKPLLLYGPPGTGKTLLAHLIAKEKNWQIFEINSSDPRTKEFIENTVLNAANAYTLSGGRRLVLIDEIDVMFKTDRGGYQGIIELLKEAKAPVILTANDIYSKTQMSKIRQLCTCLPFQKIRYPSIFAYLKEVCKREEISFVPEILKEMAQNAGGDLRAALLDLQTEGKKVSYDTIISSRERKKDVFKVMNAVFFGKKEYKEYKENIGMMDIDPGMFFNWLEENIPRQYTPSACSNAFNWLSKGDLFEGRIIYKQYWGFRRYSIDLAGFGSLLSREKKGGFIKLQFPTKISLLSRSKKEREKTKEIAKKLKEKMHSSSKEIIASDLPYIKIILKNCKDYSVFKDSFGLDEKDISFLCPALKTHKKQKTNQLKLI